MRKKFWQYYWDSLHDFGEAVINIFIFLPYFFSVSSLFKTLFQPWKNLVVRKTFVGFSFSDSLNRFVFNLISRSIGVLMRLLMIGFYFIFQTLFMVFLPFIALSFFLLTPVFYFFSFFQKTDFNIKNVAKKKFIEDHLLSEENILKVENWFEEHYEKHLKKTVWWKLQNLLSYPPLARDWAVGYTPILDQYAIDLASSSYLHHIKNMVGRNKEIAEIEQVLTKSSESNVMIVGEEGVGKHTIVDAFAKKIYLGNINSQLMYKRILKLNMEKILSEFVDLKQRENFLEDLLNEASQAENIILFIDNFDKYINLISSFEKYVKTNLIQIIGVTTPFAYQQFIDLNEKINRLFNKIDVYEVTNEEAEIILLNTVFEFEETYKIIIPYETIKEVIEKSEFYLTYIPFPEKAIDLLDMACAYIKQNPRADRSRPVPRITPEIVNIALTEMTHIPTTITKQMKEKLLSLETILFSKIIQQDEATKKLSEALKRSFLLIGKRKKPLASFLFLGPTGVGKTETAKVVSEFFFENHLLRFDMSEFQSKYDIPKLIGDADNPGFLTAKIRQQSYGVLLLDEIEKADKNLINIFLTITDEGYFIDGQGKKVDCKNLIIIATSNAQNNNIFSPEFLNRFDGIITFESLNKDSIKIIAQKIISQLVVDIQKLHKVKLVVSEKTLDNISKKGYDPLYGARNLERTIRDEIENKVANLIFEDKVKSGETINL